jgi:hypothetical protein
MTIDSKQIIVTMLRNYGMFPGDPQSHAIWQYENAFGATTWWVTMRPDVLLESAYVNYPQMLWSREGFTPLGEAFLKENIGVSSIEGDD